MSLFWIIALVFLLYIRTIKYNYVIDDNVKRQGYMYDVPLVAPDYEFFKKRPSVWYRLFMISMHCVNVSIIYLLWGWAPALLYAVHPISVWGTAWVTGNYYATATYFTLISYYIIQAFPNIWGALVAMPIFAAALNSTVCPIPFPFIFFFGNPWGLSMFIPLAIYFKGNRFKTGIKIRKDLNNNKLINDGIVKVSYFRRIAIMAKIIARYIYVCFFPDKLGFFDNYGNTIKEDPKVYNQFHSFNKEFWASFFLCLTVFIGGLFIHPIGTLWFFAFALLHSQWNLMGQFYAQRYLYLSSIGLCVVVGTLLQAHPIVLACVVTFLVLRTHLFIPIWKNMETVWRNDTETFPQSGIVWSNIAQWYLQGTTLPNWRLNEIAYFLFKAEALDPTSWEIQMNIACFFAKVGAIEETIKRTQRSIELLEPLGGISMPLDVLKKQKSYLEKLLEDHKQGALGRSTFSPTPGNGERKEETNGTRKTEEGIPEPGRGSELAGREA